MNAPQKTGGSFLARLSYLLPLLSGLLLLIPAFVPHIFFYRGKSLSATISLFDLLGYLRAEASNVLHASESVSPSIYRSALFASVLTAVSWFFILWYAIFAILSAAICVWASKEISSTSLNTAKRVYRIVVPNRVFYGIFCFLPLLFPKTSLEGAAVRCFSGGTRRHCQLAFGTSGSERHPCFRRRSADHSR